MKRSWFGSWRFAFQVTDRHSATIYAPRWCGPIIKWLERYHVREYEMHRAYWRTDGYDNR